jgi:hypothetical protein
VAIASERPGYGLLVTSLLGDQSQVDWQRGARGLTLYSISDSHHSKFVTCRAIMRGTGHKDSIEGKLPPQYSHPDSLWYRARGRKQPSPLFQRYLRFDASLQTALEQRHATLPLMAWRSLRLLRSQTAGLRHSCQIKASR